MLLARLLLPLARAAQRPGDLSAHGPSIDASRCRQVRFPGCPPASKGSGVAALAQALMGVPHSASGPSVDLYWPDASSDVQRWWALANQAYEVDPTPWAQIGSDAERNLKLIALAVDGRTRVSSITMIRAEIYAPTDADNNASLWALAITEHLWAVSTVMLMSVLPVYLNETLGMSSLGIGVLEACAETLAADVVVAVAEVEVASHPLVHPLNHHTFLSPLKTTLY